MVRTPRCGRGNPGSNPGYGNLHFCSSRHIYQNTSMMIEGEMCVVPTQHCFSCGGIDEGIDDKELVKGMQSLIHGSRALVKLWQCGRVV